MVATYEIADADSMRALGEELSHLLQAGDVIALTGPLGAGKTTLTQGLGLGLNVSGAVTSPTFVVSRVHRSLATGLNLIHIDAYRLHSADELLDLGLDDLDESVVVMEWGEAFVSDLKDSWLSITIDRGSESDDDPSGGLRVVTISGHGARWSHSEFAAVHDD